MSNHKDLKLQISYLKENEITPYVNNTRTHSREQIEQVKASIAEFGMVNPIGLHEGVIVYGHARFQAMKELDYEEFPTVDLSHLTEAQKKAYVIADNKLALNAGWDEEILALEIKALEEMDFDLDLLGFDDKEINAFLEEETEDNEQDDEVPEPPANPVSVLGDVWQLGDHRLMCGDSTSKEQVDTLINGETIHMIFTDPPYNVAFNGRSGKHEVIKNDNLSESDFGKFIDGFIEVVEHVNPKAYYIWCNWNFYGILQGKLKYKNCIVWAKNVFGLGKGYRHQHEFCLFNGAVDAEIKNESDLWEIKKDHAYKHPTQKPVALSVRAFGNHIELYNVLDLFGGSGSTLIGAEKTRRKAFVMELDPKYVDLIVTRWQEFTGKNAIHVTTGKSFVEVHAERLEEQSA